MMAKAKYQGRPEQFNFALRIIEKKVGRALLPVFTAISIVFFISAFIEFRGMLDFVFRIIAGLLFVALSLWGLNRVYGNRPAAFIVRILSGQKRKHGRRRVKGEKKSSLLKWSLYYYPVSFRKNCRG
jgi:TM2 domain-containing membrane protein YozV